VRGGGSLIGCSRRLATKVTRPLYKRGFASAMIDGGAIRGFRSCDVSGVPVTVAAERYVCVE